MARLLQKRVWRCRAGQVSFKGMKPEFLHRVPVTARRWLTRFGLAFVLYSLFGFLVLPPLIKWQMLKHLPDITKRQAAVRQVKVNPWTLSLTVSGLALTESDGRRAASWDELYVNFQASSLFRWGWTFKEIRLVNPFGELILFKNGRLNFSNMLQPQANASSRTSKAASIPRVNIFSLVVTNGFVALEDRMRRSVFRTEYKPINVRLQEFSTRPNMDAPYSFRAESDTGRSVTWAGDLSVQPLGSSGHLELTGIRLSRYQPYLEEFTRAILTNGLADVRMDYRFEAGTNGVDLVATNGAMHVEQVQVLDPGTGESVATLRNLEVRQAEFNLRERAVRLGAVNVSEASLLTRLQAGARLNLLELVTLPPPSTNASSGELTSAPSLAVTVDDFTIENTSVSFEDLTRRTPFRTELKPIELSLKHFTTRTDSDASYSFHLATEAAEKFEGVGTLSINPIRSSGEIGVAAVDLKKYLPYVEDFFRGKIVSGKLEARIPYRFVLGTNAPLAGVTNLAVRLTDLEVLMPESAERVTRIPEVGLERVSASLEDRRGRVGLFKGSGGSVLLRREKDGAVNLLGLLAVSRRNAVTGEPPAPESSATPQGRIPEASSTFALGSWVLDLDELSLDDYTVKVEDLVPSKPGSFLLERLSLNVKGASTVSNTPITASMSLRVNETGSIKVGGSVKIAPLSADMDIDVTSFDLRAAQPYVEQFVRLGVVSGAFGTTGKVRFQTHDPGVPQLTFVGGLSVTNFVATDMVMFKEFMRWDELDVAGIDFAFQPNHLKVDGVRLVRPRANVLVGADRRPNFALILAGDDARASRPANATTATARPLYELFPVQLGTLTLEEASLGFSDESIQPHAAIAVQEMSGTIKGLSSALNTMAEVNLTGKVDAQSPFAVSGRVNPFATQMFVDLVITNSNTQLTPFTGYMEKYAGHPLNKGRVSTSLHYHIEGRELKAENKVRIDQLTLGARNNSPDATSLPVRLGVALLKDSEGRIELDVPLSGRLDDPEFSLAPIVLKVVVNIIMKAAASPFKLLGALVGGGGDELSFVEFKPGGTNLVEGDLDKLGKLAAALAKRPTLSLEIEGAVDPDLDRDALARGKLSDQIKARRLQELSVKGRAPESSQGFQIEPEERDRLLRVAFIERFGTNIAMVIQTNLARLTATNQPAAAPAAKAAPKAKGGPFARVARVFHRIGRKPPAERHLTKADRQALGLATPELMEELLAEKVEVTDEEFRDLITARARWVQDWLLQNGHVAADRLFLLAPKPVDAAYRGESRVNLSLN